MNTIKSILVCVTQQKTCERLIRKAAELSDEYRCELYVLHVAKENWNFLDNSKESEALEYLFGISKSVGANLTVLKSDQIIQSIFRFAIDNKIGCIVMGDTPSDHKENRFYNELKNLLNGVEIKVIP